MCRYSETARVVATNREHMRRHVHIPRSGYASVCPLKTGAKHSGTTVPNHNKSDAGMHANLRVVDGELKRDSRARKRRARGGHCL